MFQLVDIRHKPSQDDLQMIDFLIENEFPFVLILTKKDKLTKTQLAERSGSTPDRDSLCGSGFP